MNRNLKASKSIIIDSTPEDIWEVLTNPEKIKLYLYGTETLTNWKVGSTILFQGEYNGQQYKDKGNVLENDRPNVLKYNYWSGFSGLEDKAENYALVSYKIVSLGANRSEFTWLQEGFANEEGKCHTENGLENMLQQIKQLVEEDK